MDAKQYAANSAGYIALLYLEPDYRNRGLAVQLLGAAAAFFRKNNLNAIRLLAAEHNNRAIKFYERYGFISLPELDAVMNGVNYKGFELAI